MATASCFSQIFQYTPVSILPALMPQQSGTWLQHMEASARQQGNRCFTSVAYLLFFAYNNLL